MGSPWGARQPEPYFDASEKIYHVALQKRTRSPFRPNDELFSAEEKTDKKDKRQTPKARHLATKRGTDIQT